MNARLHERQPPRKIQAIARARALLSIASNMQSRVILTLAAAVLASALGSVGCGAGTTPRTRVAADLGCTGPDTRVEKVEDLATDRPSARWKVTGCGRTATYICTTPVRDCWREGAVGPETAVYSPR